jgi:Flp pilus assembly protein TadB
MSLGLLLTVAAVGGMVLFLVLGVAKSVMKLRHEAVFDAALEALETSEIDIDTSNEPKGKKLGFYDGWTERVRLTGRTVDNPKTIGSWVIVSSVFAGMFGVLVWPGGPVGVLFVLVPTVGLRWWVGKETRKRVLAMEKQLPSLLSGLRANLQAGSTPQQAIISVADDIPSPLGDELKALRSSLSVAVPLEVALEQLNLTIPSREMKFLASSIEIAVRSGADLDPQLATIEEVVAARQRIRQKLVTAVASAQPTRVTAMLAVPLFLLNSMRAPENRAFWQTSNGFFTLCVLGALVGLGTWGFRILIKRVENT